MERKTFRNAKARLVALILAGAFASSSAAADGAVAGPYVRLNYNSPGTCCLKVGLWAFPLPVDYNRDGIADLVVSCPDTPNHGTFFFQGTPSGVFKPGVRIDGELRWNAAVSHVGGRPVVSTPLFTHWNFLDGGYEVNEETVRLPRIAGLSEWQQTRRVVWRYADWDGDGKVDRLCFCGGRVKWERGIFGEGASAAFASPEELTDGIHGYGDVGDVDGDGLPDLLSLDRNDGFAWKRSVRTGAERTFAARRILRDTTGGRLHMHVCMNTATLYDWDRDGRLDIVCGDEDGRVAWMRNSGTSDCEGSPAFAPPEFFREERTCLKQGVLVAPSSADWDGDGDLDLICGDSAGNLSFIENLSGKGVEAPSWAEPKLLSCEGAGGIPAAFATNSPIRIVAGERGSIQGPGEAKWGYTSPVVADWDGDGVLDVLVNSVWGYVYWHRNLGTPRAPRLGPATPVVVDWKGAQPELAWGGNKPNGGELMTQWRTTPLATDWDDDGLPDLVMLDTEGYLALFRRTVRNGRRTLCAPERVFIDEATGLPLRPNAGVKGASGRRKLCAIDWDGDGNKDFFISSPRYHQHLQGESVDYWRQTRAGDGKWHFRNLGRLSPTRLHGHSCAPTPVDFNADGIPDVVIGGEDGYFYYLRNPRSGKVAKTPLMVNEDPWYFIGHASSNDMNVAGLQRHVDRYALGGKVTDMLFCVNGMRTAYPSKVTDPFWRTVLADGTAKEDRHHPLRKFFEAGIDPFQVWIDRCRATGIRPWVSMRINDVHHLTSGKPDAGCTFWRQHPELRRSPKDPTTPGMWWTDFAFNFAKREVRDYALAVFCEIVNRYDADGYELDTLRFWQNLTPGREREEAPLLTEFIRSCRECVRTMELKRGHPIRLSARVLTSYEATRAFGYDPEAWAREDLVDLIVVCNFFNTVDTIFDFGEWKRRIREANPRTAVLPGATDCFECEPCRLDAAAYRGWAERLFGQGAEGVYLYNTSYLPENVKRTICAEGLTAESVMKGSRRYPLTHHDIVPKGVPSGRRLPVPLDVDREFPVDVGKGIQEGERAFVVLGIVGDDVATPEVTVNGTKVDLTETVANRAKYGATQKVKRARRFALPKGVIHPGKNSVRVGALQKPAPQLRWLEIEIER